MSQQLQITGGAKVRDLNDVIIGTSGVLSSLAFNVANGVPKLDSNAKILVSQLPNSVMEYLGTWNAATNTPFLVNGTGNAGDVYLCNVAGTVDFGAGPISFVVSDQVIYSGSIWQKASGSNGTVTSIGLSSTGNDAITITGSPVTTSGTINLGFAGTNLQYINGAGDLTTFPTLISSIGLTMPSAFSVANSPLTSNGTIAVTGAGYPSQYIRGDGTLADFPTSGGGGSSVSYYLNGGTSQGTIGGVTYYEMSKTADTGTMADFSLTGDGFIVAFLTDAGDPAQLNIPAGNWNYEIYASMSSNGGTPQMYAELYVYNGTTFTLISTSSNEILYDGVNLNLYTFAMTVPATTLALTDRLAIKLYSTNSGGKTTTVHTQDSHLCQIITTFSTGITALNGLTAQVQYFATGTSGTDFNISSTTATHTFNLPDASATNRGLITTGTQTIAGAKTFSGGVTSNSFYAQGNGTQGGYLYLKQGTTPYAYLLGSNGISADGTKFLLIANVDASNNKSALFELGSLANNTSRTFTLPDASGTLALTSNLSSYVPYTGATGAVNLGAFDLTVNGVNVGKGAGSGLTYNTRVGALNFMSNTTGAYNSSFGYESLNANTTGLNNTAIGFGSLFINTTGNYNTAIGSATMMVNIIGSNNTAVGYGALGYNLGNNNIAVGSTALVNNTTGNNNTAIGPQAGSQITTGANNTLVGGFIGSPTISNNIILSDGAGNIRYRWDGTNNVFSNPISGTSATFSSDLLVSGLTIGRGGSAVVGNTAIGAGTLAANTTGVFNTAIGYYALASNTIGVSNTAIGSNSLLVNTTGNNNTAIGTDSLNVNTTGSKNTAIGYYALVSNTTASNNIAIGYYALSTNSTAQYNLAIGNNSLRNNVGTQNIGIGEEALLSNTIGQSNTAIGFQALQGNTTGGQNFALGIGALANNTTGSGNIAIGASTLASNITTSNSIGIGFNSLLFATGGNNIAIGNESGKSITTGSNNTIIGAYAGTAAMSNNIVLADGAGTIRYQWNGTNNAFTGAATFSSSVSATTGTFSGKISANTSNGIFSNFGGTSIGVTAGNYTGISLGYSENTAYTKTAIVQEQINDGNTRGHLHFLVDTANDGNNAVLTDSKMMINGLTGNVGILASDPVKTLDVRGTLAISNSSSSYWYMDRDDSDGRFKILTDGNSEKFSIATSGAATFSSSVNMGGDLALTPNDSAITFSSGAGRFFTGGTERMRITSGGVVQITGLTSNGTVSTQSSNGSLYVSSDANLKIEDGFVENGLEKVLALKPRYFYWKDKEAFSADRQLGFYAQEVNAVSEETANTPPEGCGWGIYDRGLVALLTKAIQEQQALITSLQDRLDKAGL